MPKKTPTVDGVTGQGTEPDPQLTPPTDQEIVNALESYRKEADNERKTGLNPRDDKWRENLDLYWNRWDFTDKAAWQAKEKMPEVPSFVDRFAAAMTEALVSDPSGFYTIKDPGDREGDLTKHLKKMTDAWLSTSGRNQNGYPLAFPSVFEEQVKLGALMAMSAVVTWKTDVPGGRVAIETVDPRMVWLDSTYRNLYRVRRVEIDRHDLAAMAQMKDGEGNPIFRLPQLDQLVTSLAAQDPRERQELTGIGQMQTAQSGRQPIVLDEYIATVLDSRGQPIKERGLYVVANERHLIRGPEDNPFWHGRDWLLYAALGNAPLSVYGRSYMEDFGSIARAFNELTNMILDAVYTTSLKAFAAVPGYLLNPGQLNTGIHGNKVFLLEEGIDPKSFMEAIDLGNLPPESMSLWQGLKNELREASGMNEVATGQFAPKGRTSASEVQEVSKSSSALIRSVASSVETRFLNPMLDLTWKTGLQHARAADPVMQSIVGPVYPELMARRRELISRPITFQARAISGVIEKASTLRSLFQLLQIIGSNQLLLQEFLKEISVNKLVKWLFNLANVPLEQIELSEREKLISSMTAPIQEAQDQARKQPGSAGSGAVGAAQREMASLAGGLGIAA